jgi:para-aminobenzoate synthetase
MRLLLIDNHDSFSAILHHYLWELAGEKPLFVRNDALSRDELESLEIDAAVLSPGPGHPANVRDFGACLDLLQLRPDLPILGVCLGHQGLVHFAGGRISPWPGSLHGRPSHVRHDGTGLFRGLPPDFEAIRYHSLVADAATLPGNIRVTAASVEDGCVMGASFTDRPWHGVQFHPESVGTEHGKALLKNFLDLARPGAERRLPPSSSPSRAPVAAAAPVAQAGLAIPFVELPWREPADVFLRHFPEEAGTFWFDASEASERQSARGWPVTVLGKALEPGERHEFRDWGAFQAWYDGLGLEAARAAPWPGYRGGPVGHLAYELHRDTLGTPTPRSGEPLARWMLPEGYLVFDRGAGKAYAAWEHEAPPAWLRAVIDGWDAEAAGASPAAALSEALLPPVEAWTSTLSEAEHAARVHSLQASIAAGDTYEACLTHALTVEASAGARAVFLRLRERNPAPYAAWMAFPGVRVLSASPELFLERAEGVLRSRPIKGTRPRGSDAASDRALREDLARSEKDRAENRMIVDLTRHDFARACELGSVEVTSLLEVEAHPAVFQMVSEVRGRPRAGASPLEAVAACFPGGSMTGAPKERTVELLAALEPEPRGIYSGALGWFTRGGDFSLSMVIRTLENRGDRWRVGCGGAILADSDAAGEWREARLKARSVIDAAASLSFSPESR